MLQYPDNPDFVPSAYGPPEPLKQGDRKFKRQSRPAVVVDDSNRSFGADKDYNKDKNKDCNKDKYKDCDNKDKRQSRLAVVVDDSNRPLNTDRLRLEKAKRKVKMS